MVRYSWENPFLQQASGPKGWEFPTKMNSAEDRIDGTNGYFWQNSGAVLWNRKLLEFRSEPFFFCGRKNNWELQYVLWNKNRSKLLEFYPLQIEVWTNHIVKLFWLFCKTNFSRSILFHSELRIWLFRWTQNVSEWASSAEYWKPFQVNSAELFRNEISWIVI